MIVGFSGFDSGLFEVWDAPNQLRAALFLNSPPPLWESFKEAGFAKVNHRKLLGFPRGPGIQKYCRYGPWGTLMEFPMQGPSKA